MAGRTNEQRATSPRVHLVVNFSGEIEICRDHLYEVLAKLQENADVRRHSVL